MAYFIHEALELAEGYDYKGYIIQKTDYGYVVLDSNKKYVAEFPSDKEAEEYIDNR